MNVRTDLNDLGICLRWLSGGGQPPTLSTCHPVLRCFQVTRCDLAVQWNLNCRLRGSQRRSASGGSPRVGTTCRLCRS